MNNIWVLETSPLLTIRALDIITRDEQIYTTYHLLRQIYKPTDAEFTRSIFYKMWLPHSRALVEHLSIQWHRWRGLKGEKHIVEHKHIQGHKLISRMGMAK